MSANPVLSRRARLSVALAACVLSACSLAPVYERPQAPVPAHWPAASAGTPPVPPEASSASGLDWRSFVVDETLRHLVASALEHNRDLRQAMLNVEAARAQYRIQAADRLPNVALGASETRQRVPGGLSATGAPGVVRSHQAGVMLTAFEVDLFGRLRSLSDAALEHYFSVEANAKAARISLIAEVVQAHLARDGASRKLVLTQRTLDSRIKSYELVSRRHAAGAAGALDRHEALMLQEQARADLERLSRELRQATHALQLLVGTTRVPDDVPERPAAEPPLRQRLAAGLPSELLANRPDILEAEHVLRARYASIGAARAAFFPSISLTASLGSASPELSGLFDGGQRAWAFVPQLNLPIFDGGRNRANLDAAGIRRDVAIAQYEKAIQSAFREVADALAASDTLAREETSRRALTDASLEAVRLSRARYLSGVDTHLRLLEAERTSYASQIALIDVVTSRQIALTNLYKALGGGWKTE